MKKNDEKVWSEEDEKRLHYLIVLEEQYLAGAPVVRLVQEARAFLKKNKRTRLLPTVLSADSHLDFKEIVS